MLASRLALSRRRVTATASTAVAMTAATTIVAAMITRRILLPLSLVVGLGSSGGGIGVYMVVRV